MAQGRIKGLNSLRFFAAFLVLAGHARLDLLKLSIAQPNWPCLRSGPYAVEFFFVLSGFLLTHLAIEEFSSSGRIDVKGFYQRRILRIWPLYYLCLAIGLILLGGVGPFVYGQVKWPEIGRMLPYFIFMAPNLAIALHPLNMGAVYALWSIGVEEQFYLFFPFLMMALLRGKYPLRNLAWLAAGYTILYLILFHLTRQMNEALFSFTLTLKFHYMLYGCTAAMLWQRKPAWVERMLPKSPITGWALLVMVLAMIFVGPPPGLTGQTLFSGALYAAIILHLRRGDARAMLAHPILDHLGHISYGIYMFHPYLSYVLRYAAQRSPACLRLFSDLPLAYYLSLTLMTIIVAHFSYVLFESRFLRLKRYATRA